MNNKKIVVFIHIPKTGGSSFWHALADSASKSPDIAIGDSLHEALIRNEPKENAYFHAIRMCDDLEKMEQNTLLMHMHYPKGNYRDISHNINYILLHRNPLERMRSAFRHWLQKSTAGGYKFPATDFFLSDFAPGINEYLSSCFSASDSWFRRPSADLLNFVRENVTSISFSDYINSGWQLGRLSKKLGISEIPVIHHPKTVTDKKFDRELDLLLSDNEEFKINWNYRLHWENQWHRDIGLPEF